MSGSKKHTWGRIRKRLNQIGPYSDTTEQEDPSCGGGTGMATYEFKGGPGTASRIVRVGNTDYTIGVLVQSNFGQRTELTILGVPVGKYFPDNAVINAMIAAEAMTTVKPAGYKLESIDHERLKEIMRQHNRLKQ